MTGRRRASCRLAALVLATAGLGLTGGVTAVAEPGPDPGQDPPGESVATVAGDASIPPGSAGEGANPAVAVPAGPSGGLRNLVLAQDVFAKDRGAVLGIDESGWLWAYPGGPGGKLGKPMAIGQDFESTDLYPTDGWLRPYASEAYSTEAVVGVTCNGDMYRYQLGYLNHADHPGFSGQQIGNGWSGYRIIPVGDVSGDWYPDLLAVKEATGDLFLYRSYAALSRFYSPYPKVGNGWQDYELLPAGDLSGDGRNDILGINPAGDLYLYKGLGNGYFATKVKVGNGWTGYDLMAGADIDGDGLGDIMGRADDGRLFFYRGLGGGKFATKVQVGNGWGPSGVTKDCSDGTNSRGTMLRIPWLYPDQVPMQF